MSSPSTRIGTRLPSRPRCERERRFADDKRRRWQAWGDSVDEFISECVHRDEDAPKISTNDAWRRYVAWCREHNKEDVGQQQFTNTLKHEDVEYRQSMRIDGASARGYMALGFTDAVPALPSDNRRRRDDDDDTRPPEVTYF